MSVIEGVLFWVSIFLYFVTFILHLIDSVFRKEGAGRNAWNVFLAGFLLQTLTILWRWYISGRIPVMVSYEHYQIGSWFIAVAAIGGGLFYPRMRIVSMPVAAVILLMLGVGVGTPSDMAPMRPPFRSNWLFIHIGFAWFAWGCFVVATVLAVAYILKRPGKVEGRFLQKFPSREIMDELMMKLILFGFVCQGLMIAAGAIWAHQLWGRYWAWDPIETWSLVCWLVYGLVLHFRLMMGWKGVKIAVSVIFAILTAIVYFWGIGFLPESHTSLMLMNTVK